MYIKAVEKDFPLAFTVEAQSKLAEKAGRLEDLQELFDTEDAAVSVDNTVWALSVMMEAHVNREKVKCRMLGETYDGGDAPSYDDLRAVLENSDIISAMNEITAAMKNGQKTTVEIQEEKNVKTTQ